MFLVWDMLLNIGTEVSGLFSMCTSFAMTTERESTCSSNTYGGTFTDDLSPPIDQLVLGPPVTR